MLAGDLVRGADADEDELGGDRLTVGRIAERERLCGALSKGVSQEPCKARRKERSCLHHLTPLVITLGLFAARIPSFSWIM